MTSLHVINIFGLKVVSQSVKKIAPRENESFHLRLILELTVDRLKLEFLNREMHFLFMCNNTCAVFKGALGYKSYERTTNIIYNLFLLYYTLVLFSEMAQN